MIMARHFLIIGYLLLAPALAFAGELYVVVSKDSPINNISNKELANIFLSLEPRFNNGDKARPHDLNSRSAYRAFYKIVANKSRLKVKTYWGEMVFSGKGLPPEIIKDEDDIQQLAEDIPGFIGYTTKPPEDGVKVIKIISY